MSSLEAVELVDRIWARDPTIWSGADEGRWLGWLDEPEPDARAARRARGARLRLRERRAARHGRLEPRPGGDPAHVRGSQAAGARHDASECDPAARGAARPRARRSSSRRRSRARPSRRAPSSTTSSSAAAAATFAAITDPGTELEQFAREHDFACVVRTASRRSAGATRRSRRSGWCRRRCWARRQDAARARRARWPSGAGSARRTRASSSALQLGEGWSEGRDKVCIDETPGGFGLWAEQLIAESTGKQGKGLVPAPGEDPPAGPTASAGACGSTIRTTSAPSSSAGSSRPRSPARSSASTRSTSRTSRPRRTGRARSSRRGDRSRDGPEGSLDELLARREPPHYIAIQAFIDPDARGRARRRSSTARARQAASSRTASARATCTRPGSCTRAARTPSSSSRSWTTSARSWRFPGKDFGFRQLIAAQAAGDLEALKERGRRSAA